MAGGVFYLMQFGYTAILMYNKPFRITDNVSNNSFSFGKRNNPSIFVTDIIDGSLSDVQIGDAVVFEDFDENGHLKSCVGLKHFIRISHPKTGKPIIIVDNHNHVFYFWHEASSLASDRGEARKRGLLQNNSTLIHIDQHKDMREPSSYLSKQDSEDLQKVFDYTNTVLNVGNYILPAVRDGLIGKVIQITGEKELILSLVGENDHSRLRDDGESIILNIDLDFWAPEMDYIDKKLKIERTKEWMARADVITIATSPFFVKQERAIGILRELLV